MSHPKTEFQTISSLFPSFSLRSGKQDQGDTRTSFFQSIRWPLKLGKFSSLSFNRYDGRRRGASLLSWKQPIRSKRTLHKSKSIRFTMCVNRLIQNYRRTPEKLHAVQIKPPHFSELLMVHFIETLYYFTKLPYLLSCDAMLTNCNSPHSKASHWNPWILFLSISYYSNSLLSTRIHKYYYQESVPLR